jgi:hypothetical protein
MSARLQLVTSYLIMSGLLALCMAWEGGALGPIVFSLVALVAILSVWNEMTVWAQP